MGTQKHNFGKMMGLFNASFRRLENLFPGYFPEAKHDHYSDFGWPKNITFDQFYQMYSRNGIATAGVDRTIEKTWESNPKVLDSEFERSASREQTKTEKEIARRFKSIRFWQCLQTADNYSIVGRYSGLIFRLADGKDFKDPVTDRMTGLDALVEVIPAWEGQLRVSSWVEDKNDENYGKPAMFEFNEAQVRNENGTSQKLERQFQVHPDRVYIWSKDGTIHGRSILEPGYNALMDLEKIGGAGGEGFWKNSKNAPVFELDKEISLQDMAAGMGSTVDEVYEKVDDQVDDFQKGFDKSMILQGMTAKVIPVDLPPPEQFYLGRLMEFCASIKIPVKILTGSQTGERASTEDAEEWAKTINSRRTFSIKPNIIDILEKMESWGIIPDMDWDLDWKDLTESSMVEKIERVGKMGTVNKSMEASGEMVFTHEEMREVVNLKPLSESEKFYDIIEDDGVEENEEEADDDSNQ